MTKPTDAELRQALEQHEALLESMPRRARDFMKSQEVFALGVVRRWLGRSK